MMSDHYAVSFIQRLECEIILRTAVEQSVALHFIDGKKMYTDVDFLIRPTVLLLLRKS